LCELGVELADRALRVDDQDAVGGRVQRRAEERQRRVELGERALVLLGLRTEQPHDEGHSENAQGCIRAFTIPERNLQKILPATGDTRIELGALTAGTLDYVCGMGMYTGEITIN